MQNQIATSPQTPSALPDAWIDRLFHLLLLAYGSSWSSKWEGVPMAEVKAEWASCLAFASADQMRRALDHCKTSSPYPPSLPEFATLCKAFAPPPDTRNLLPPPRGGTIHPSVQAEITKLLDHTRKQDPKDWARRILKEHADGTYRHIIGIQKAREALGLEPL